MSELINRICLSPQCDDTDRFIIENSLLNNAIHRYDKSYIVSFQEIVTESSSTDIFSKSRKKMSDFTHLLVTSQNNLQSIQIYRNNQNEIHQFLIGQCLKVSKYYQSFEKISIIGQIRDKNKKAFIKKLNILICQDHVMEMRVFQVILNKFNEYLSTEELKQQIGNKDSFLQYLQSKFDQILQMRTNLISNLIPKEIPLDSDLNQHNMKYVYIICRIYKQEVEAVTYLKNLSQKQNYEQEIASLDQMKNRLIEYLLRLSQYFSSQLDIQSTFSTFREIYQIDIYDKHVLDQLISLLKKFDYPHYIRAIYTLSILIFPSNLEVFKYFLDNLFPEIQNYQLIMNKISEYLPQQTDKKRIYGVYYDIFQKYIKDEEISTILIEIIQQENITLTLKRMFLNILKQMRNVYYTEGIPLKRLLQNQFNVNDIFTYTLQKQAERKEQIQLKEKERKKNIANKESVNNSSGDKKRNRNTLEKKFENFKQQTKQRRSILNSILQHDQSKQQNSPKQQPIQQINEDQMEQEEEINTQSKENLIQNSILKVENNDEDQSTAISNKLQLEIQLVNMNYQQNEILLELSAQTEDKCMIQDQKLEHIKIEREVDQNKPEKCKVKQIKLTQIEEHCIVQVKGESNKQVALNDYHYQVKQKKKIKGKKNIRVAQESQDKICQQNSSHQDIETRNDTSSREDNTIIEPTQENIKILNNTNQDEDIINLETKDNINNLEDICNKLCQNPFDQEYFLQLFSSLSTDNVVLLCQKFNEILFQCSTKQEINSKLLNLYSAASYFYLNQPSLSKHFLIESCKFQFNNIERLNQLGFIQIQDQQVSSAIINFQTSINISCDQSQWFSHASLGYIYNYAYQNAERAIHHYLTSLDLKFVNNTSFFILFQLGLIYYHNLRSYNVSIEYFNLGFQQISKNNLKLKINHDYFTESILDFSMLNYRIGDLQSSKKSIDFFFQQDPKKNLDVAYYLQALIYLQYGDFQMAENILQILQQTVNKSMKIEYYILKGFIAYNYLHQLKTSKEWYLQAWILLNEDEQNYQTEKRIRVLKKLIFFDQGISFFKEIEIQFINNLSKTDLIGYLEFLFQFGVSRYNQYLNEIIQFSEQRDSFRDKPDEEIQDKQNLIKVFEECLDRNHRRVDCMYMIGKCYKDLVRDNKKSLEYFYSILKFNPNHYKSMIQILEIFIVNQNYEQGSLFILKFDNLHYETIQKIYLEGKMFQQLGDFQRSIEIYLQLFNNQRFILPIQFFRLVQKDYQYCSSKLQQNSIKRYIK